jgi:hypothetical protein
MARCEDFPCCGHYDEGTYNSWCPDESGKYPPLNIPTCRHCGMYIDPEDGHDCDNAYEPDDEEELEYDDEDEYERLAIEKQAY